MRTDDLIKALAADARPGPGPEHWLRRALPPALGFSAIVMLALLGLRGDLAAAVAPFTFPKTLLPLGLGLIAVVLGLRLARPLAATGRLPVFLLSVPVIAALIAGLRMITSDPASWQMQMTGKTMVACLVSIPSLALVPLLALLWALRHGAPLAPGRAGFVAGLAAGGFAAAVYSLHCNEDSPLFWALWYSSAILITASLGAALGARLLRW